MLPGGDDKMQILKENCFDTGSHKKKLGFGVLLNSFRRKNRKQLEKNSSDFCIINTEQNLEEISTPSSTSFQTETAEPSSNQMSKIVSKENEQPVRTDKTNQKNSEDEEVYCTFTYLSIMTALYLTFLLFLWIRRNVFGTESMVWSLFFGHMLRYAVAFSFLPPSATKSFMPEPMLNAGQKLIHHLEKVRRDKKVQGKIPAWVSSFLGTFFGMNTDKSSLMWGNQVTSDIRISPPLVLLWIVTLVLFIVHPDGLTWIMIGKLRESIKSSIHTTLLWIDLVRKGEVKLSVSQISSTTATLIIIFTIINSIKLNCNNNAKSPLMQKERTKIRSGKKGKKGRGRNFSKLKCTHNRNDHFDDLMSQSRSPSPLRKRCLSDMECTTISASSESNTVVIDSCSTFVFTSSSMKEDDISNSNHISFHESYRNMKETSTRTSSSNDIDQKPSYSKTADVEEKRKKQIAIQNKPMIVNESLLSLPSTSNTNKGLLHMNGQVQELKEDISKRSVDRNTRRVKINVEDKFTRPLRERKNMDKDMPTLSTSLGRRIDRHDVKNDRNFNQSPRLSDDEIKSPSSYHRLAFDRNQTAQYLVHPIVDSSAALKARSMQDANSDFPMTLRTDDTLNHSYLMTDSDCGKEALIKKALKHKLHQDLTNLTIQEPIVPVLRVPPGIETQAIKIQSGNLHDTEQSNHSDSLFSSHVVRSSSLYDFSVGSISANTLADTKGISGFIEHSNGTASYYDPLLNQVVLPALSPLHQPASYPRGSELDKTAISGEEDVEAEMEVLGGQMAVSILDF